MSKSARPIQRSISLGLIGLIILVLGVRLSFVGHGAMALPDEERYFESVEAVKSLAASDVQAACAHLIRTQGRPGDALLRLIPAGAQGVFHAVGGPGPHELESLMIPVLFTYGVSVLSLLLYYRLAQQLLASNLGALVSTLLYACLTNSNLYIRHILPYELALCCFLVLLLWLVRAERQGRTLGLGATYGLGLGAAFVFTVYPGYFLAPLLLLVVLLNQQKDLRLKPRLYQVGAFSGGVLSVLGFFEMLGRLSGYSYLKSCLRLSGTITQGDFRESFVFLIKYLLEAEGMLGIALFCLVASALVVGLSQVGRAKVRLRVIEILHKHALYLGALGAFLAYAALSFFGHKLVFYGRILHLFFPFLVLFAVGFWFRRIRPRAQLLLTVALAGIALCSFGSFAVRYRAVFYPYDLLAQPSADLAQRKVSFRSQTELSDNADHYLARQHLARNTTGKGEAVLLNFGNLYPIVGTSCNPLPLPPGYRLVFSAPHFLTIPAYGFEGFTPHERAMLRQCHYQCQIFVRP